MKNITTITGLLLLAAFSSCRKTIDIAVKDASARYVIEAQVTDQDAPWIVKLTRTVALNSTNSFPAVSGASVSIRDITLDKEYQLSETEAGIYESTTTKGMPGHQYMLVIKTGENVFSAVSTMPYPVSLDTMYIVQSYLGTDIRGGYHDPAEAKNFYHFVTYKNGKIDNGNTVADDAVNNGLRGIQAISYKNDSDLKSGDRIALQLECVDPNVHQYYFALAQTADQSSTTPANPKSNISGNALGYFSAHTVSTKTIVLP